MPFIFIKTVAPILKCIVPSHGTNHLCSQKPSSIALWFLRLLSDFWLPWAEMEPERLEVSTPVSKSVGGHVWSCRCPSAWLLTSKEPLLHQGRSDRRRAPYMSGNGEEWPVISDLQREAFKYSLALSLSAEGGGALPAFPAGKWHSAFCHVKNPIERNLTNPWGLPRGRERFALCAASSRLG